MTWLTVIETASLFGVTESAIKKAVAKSKYDYRHVDGMGRGGRKLQIALESLPQEAQDRYYNIQRPHKPILEYTGKQRNAANFKAWVVVQYQRMELSPEDFIAWFNGENPEDTITRNQLFRWQRQYKSKDVADLIDQRGGHNRGQSSIPEDAWEYFYALYMTQQKLKIQRCWELTRREYPDIPSVSSFERRVKTIPYYALKFYREGVKALNDALPSMERSRLDIASNAIWFSDHHLMDVFVTNHSGKAKRLWLTVFFDARSNKVMGRVIRDASPNSTAVKQCFRLSAEQHGLPDEVYFDNGKDYKSKSFSVSSCYPMSLVNQLGIGMIYATKYHGQAKTVERFFGTLEDRFGRLFPTYAGSDAKKRPECMLIPNDEIAKIAPPMDEFIGYLDAYIAEYNETGSQGIDMNGKCPNQVYSENLHTKRVVSDLAALRLLCGNSEQRVVSKNGILIMNNSYRNEKLLSHVGEQVWVTYDPENIDQIAVFDSDNRAICMAEAHIKTPFRQTSEEDYNRAAKEKKAARAIYKQYKPTRELSVQQIMARNQLMERQYEETGSPLVAEQLPAQAVLNAEILKASAQEQTNGRRVSEEDSVSATLMKLYKKQA